MPWMGRFILSMEDPVWGMICSARRGRAETKGPDKNVYIFVRSGGGPARCKNSTRKWARQEKIGKKAAVFQRAEMP